MVDMIDYYTKILKKNKVEILMVKKRNPFICFFTTKQWEVTVLHQDKMKKLKCWAGKHFKPTNSYRKLLHSIVEKVS